MDEQRRNALIELGAYLTSTEAGDIARRLEKGATINQALGVVQSKRRKHIIPLFKAAGYYSVHSEEQRTLTISGMRSIQGAHSDITSISPVWTAPHLLTKVGDLNSSRSRLAEDARISIVCSTYNFQRSSALWKSLKTISTEHPEVSMRLYIDGSVNDGKDNGGSKTLSPLEIVNELPYAKVFCTKEYGNGRYYCNHAKFLSIDHELLLVTSANLSYSAENLNIELGLKVEDRNLTEMVEREMRQLESHVYEEIRTSSTSLL